MTDLLPCPFCGGEAKMITDSTSSWVECQNTAACEARGGFFGTPELAAKNWNTRPAQAVTITDEMVERALVASWTAAGFSGPFHWNTVDKLRMRAAIAAALKESK